MTNPLAPDIKITDAEYEHFCEFFYRTTGIRFGKQKRYFVDRRIAQRARERGCDSFKDYFRLLRFQSSSQEMQMVVDAMTVNETYFYREEEQLDLLVDVLLPELSRLDPKRSEVRLWSMPCSSGEEPYSLAIKLLENWPEVDNFEVNILGTDIDSQMIERARRGQYSERSVQKLSPDLRSKYFKQLRGDTWQVLEELRESIQFERVNALDRASMMRFDDIDVIFCRNMLIYFDDLSRRKVVDALYDALRPGGYLLVGMSESLGRTTSLFESKYHQGMVNYRKPVASRRPR